MMSKVSKTLSSLSACREAVRWAEQFDDEQTAWDQCERADWMLWIAARRIDKAGSAAHKTLVLLACEIARTVLHLVPENEKRPLKAIETAEAWSQDESTLDEVLNAANAAFAAAYAADAAAYAADAADTADAANAAYAADAAANTANAVYAAANAANAAYAGIVRKLIPVCP